MRIKKNCRGGVWFESGPHLVILGTLILEPNAPVSDAQH